MTYQTLTVTIDERGVAYVALNRPEKRNALSAQLISELTDLANTIGAQASTRAMVLTGAGDTFCAGGDLSWMMDQIKADRQTRMAEARKLAMMLNALNEMPTPLIGFVQGGAYGGGVGLACICDVTLASPKARFGLTETKLGLIPATISPYVLARMGEGRARQVFMSARLFKAAEAAELGIVSRVVEEEAAQDAIEAEVSPYLTVAPVAVGAAKALARSLGPAITPTVIDETIERLADIWETDEAREGIAAFLEKRPAPWAMD
jgi:methylglutaconyl-CoA hydratase